MICIIIYHSDYAFVYNIVIFTALAIRRLIASILELVVGWRRGAVFP